MTFTNDSGNTANTVDTSDAACALICMLVSNPGQRPRNDGWQRHVNNLIRALRDERNDLRKEIKEANARMAEVIAAGTYALARARGEVAS